MTKRETPSPTEYILRVQSWDFNGRQIQSYDRLSDDFHWLVDVGLRFVACEDNLITQAVIFRIVKPTPPVWKPLWRIRTSEDQLNERYHPDQL